MPSSRTEEKKVANWYEDVVGSRASLERRNRGVDAERSVGSAAWSVVGMTSDEGHVCDGRADSELKRDRGG